MRNRFLKISGTLLLATLLTGGFNAPSDDSIWLRTARIAGPEDVWVEMTKSEIADMLEELVDEGVNVVNIDVSYDQPSKQAPFLDRVMEVVNDKYPGLHIFAYQAPLEIVSEKVDRNRDGKIDPGRTSAFTEHPEWAQRGLNGEPAVFYGIDVDDFWVGRTDEDLWLCPNDPEYAEVWKNHLAGIAASGIDGVYIDVPFLRGWFDDRRGWRWACACEDCAAKYLDETGFNIPTKANWNDANFRRWIRWRFEQIEQFIAEIKSVITEARPGVMLIIEHWNGIGNLIESACDPALIAAHSDVRAHEWTNADSTTSSYHAFSWVEDAVYLRYYRAVDGDQPSWLLSYADEGDINAMKSLAAMTLAGGHNFWETDAPDMAGSVDNATREKIFDWIGANGNILHPNMLQPAGNIALYYPRNTAIFSDFPRSEGAGPSLQEFFGTGMLLLAEHVPFRVVTDLDELDDTDNLFLPDARCLSDDEAAVISAFHNAGGAIIATGKTGTLFAEGTIRNSNALADLSGSDHFFSTRKTFGAKYHKAAAPADNKPAKVNKLPRLQKRFRKKVLSAAGYSDELITDAPSNVIFLFDETDNGYRLAAFNTGAQEVNIEQSIDVDIAIPDETSVSSVVVLPFLGQRYEISEFTNSNGRLTFELVFERAAYVMINLQ